jgi:23S rRNA pseudouridine2605 synthase
VKAPPKSGDRPIKTLERVLSKAGLGSRAEARKWIGAGRVRVNGELVQTPDHWVDLERDKVTLDEKPIDRASAVYLLLYKPRGYLTTRKDPEGRPTVYDLIPELGQWVVPVGRLDLDTTGLLILTNDTRLAEHLMNPEHQVPKTYLVKASRLLAGDDLDRLRQGVMLDDGPTAPAEVERVRDSQKYSFIEITMREGRNRQVRRMMEAIGTIALKLVRTRIGSLTIGDLPIGKYRELTPEEVSALFGKTKSAPGRKKRSGAR